MFGRLKQSTFSSSVRRNVGMTLGRQLLAALAQLFLVVLIARHLGPEGNGFYAMAVLLPSLLANFLNFGVGPATVYYVSRRDLSVREALFGNVRLAFTVSCVGIAVALPVVWIWGKTLFPGVPTLLLYIGLISFPLTLLMAYLTVILQGKENFKAYNLTVLCPPFANLAGIVIALFLLDGGVAGAMMAYLVAQVAGVMLALALVLQAQRADPAPNATQGYAQYGRKILSYGWKAHLSNVLTFVNYRADIFLVNLFLTPVATGIYVIAVQIAEKLWMLSQAVCSVLLPRLAAMHADPMGRLALTNKGFWAVAGLTALLGGAAAGALYWLVAPVFGEQYQEAWPAFVWLLPGIIAGAGARVQSSCIAAAGKPEWNMYVALGTVTINILANLLLIPSNGIIGAALATSLAYGCNAIVKFWLVRKTLAATAY
ncbi:flippase [Alloalcanivorax gelatiniphagus]|uniref:Flippase n=1 Tax=Alloalcanivorax gelatiniphagus TaxID=1194167 RepID=A0ABY2XML0_9GAMM|nr:flippase [Alloalcanivorax gelatiniphagus]TMW13607.1 flippase [Alloalcanivorax gelatiniphagus]